MNSKHVRKQHKARYTAPLHVRQKLMGAPLAKELRTQFKKRSASVRKGDKVKVLIGNYRGNVGKVDGVSLMRGKVTIEGIEKQKTDGTKVKVWIQPSNLVILELNLEDPKRKKIIERK